MQLKIFPLSILLLCLVSCQGNTLIHEYEHVDADGWRRSDTITFLIPSVPESETYEVSVGLRLQNNFSYEEINLTTELCLENPALHKKSDLCITTTDKEGRLLGYGIAYHQYEQPCMRIQLQKGQQGKVMVYHNMNKETLSRLTDVGVCIEH